MWSEWVMWLVSFLPVPLPPSLLIHDLFVLLHAVWPSSHSVKLPWETRLGAGSYPVIEVHFSGGSVWKTVTGYIPWLDARCFRQLPLKRTGFIMVQRESMCLTQNSYKLGICEIQVLTYEAISNKSRFVAFGVSLYTSESSPLSPLCSLQPLQLLFLSLSFAFVLALSSSIIDEVIMIWSQEKCTAVTLISILNAWLFYFF